MVMDITEINGDNVEWTSFILLTISTSMGIL
jgi:hypothetical protein